jgi:hypothetical protein
MQAMTRLAIVAAVSIAAISSPPAGSVTLFDSRTEFAAAAGDLLIDDFEDPGYAEFQSDDSMNAVKGLTRYETTFFPDFNEVIELPGGHVYAGGFTSGSFRLDFTAESLGGSGVRAVAFDYFNDVASPYAAFVSFADGTSRGFTLQTAGFQLPPLPLFFGLTSDVAITQIHIGLAGGGATSGNLFALDDLSVATPVPEPGTMTLLGIGVATFAWARSRRLYQVAPERRSSRVSARDVGLPKR